MNGNQAFVRDFFSDLEASLESLADDTDVIVAPPAVYLSQVSNCLAGSNVSLAAQNVSEHENGAYTGEISASMLKDIGVDYCLVGHSERRTLFGETDSVVIDKMGRLLESGISPILCVGEMLEERESGSAQEVVERQLKAVLDAFGEEELGALVVAYEPVWAIGTGKTATPEIAQAMHGLVRSVLTGKSESLGQNCRVLYGGSVNASNAAQLFGQVDIDGGLVGGASLKSDEFKKIMGV